MVSRDKPNPTALRRLQQSFGFRDNPYGMLMDRSLRELVRPLEFYTLDWSHIFLQAGIGNVHMYHFLDGAPIDLGELRGDTCTWQLPAFRQNLASGIKAVFMPNPKI